MDADILEIQEKLDFPAQINHYMEIIKTNLKKNILNNVDILMDKLYNYIMEKLYDRIFPIEPYGEDNKIFQKSVLLSWTKPHHFIKAEEEFDFGDLEHDFLECFKSFEKEKSPRKKIIVMDKLFNLIGLALKLNKKDSDISTYYVKPLLEYLIIKSQCSRMYSNITFIELYLEIDKKLGKQGFQLSQFKSICEIIPGIKYNDLYGVTSSEEFYKKCNETTREKKN